MKLNLRSWVWFFSVAAVIVTALSQSSDSSSDISTSDSSSEELVVADQTAVQVENLLILGSTDEAFKIMESVGEAVLNTMHMQVNLARGFAQRGDMIKAEEILQQQVNASDEVLPKLTLGKLYFQLKKYDEADSLLKEATAVDASNAQVYLYLAKIFQLKGEIAQALEYIEVAYELNPQDEHILFDFGMLLFQYGEHESGKNAFDAAEEINPQIDQKLIGRIYLHYHHIDWAAEHFEKALLYSEEAEQAGEGTIDLESALILAECKDNLGDADTAVQLYELVLQREPENALAHASIGLMLLGTGNYNYAAINACGLNQEEALVHLRTALATRPELAPVTAAIDFCQLELSEVRSWRGIVADLEVSDSKDVLAGRAGDADTMAPAAGVGNFFKKLVSVLLSPLTYLLHALGLYRMNKRSSSQNNSKNTLQQQKVRSMLQHWERREQEMVQSGVYREIAEVTLTNTEVDAEFIEAFMLTNEPALLKNFQLNWGYDSNGNDIFTKEGIRALFGDSFVRVSVSESGRFDGPEAGSLWGLSDDKDVLVRPPATSMYLSDFLHLVHAETKEAYYLEYLALHQYLGNPFLDFIPFPPEIDPREETLKHLVTNLWIGGKPTTSPLHYDDYENFLCQIVGRKELILFPPTDLEYLYYTGRAKGELKYQYPGEFTRDPATVDNRSFVFGSSVNVDKPDLKQHPLYAKATPFRVVLNPGDVLYLPAFWHHEVQSVPDADTGLNIAVNFWFANLTTPVDDVELLNIKH